MNQVVKKNSREILMSFPEVEASEQEIQSGFGPRVIEESETFVKREVNGKLAQDVRKRFSAPADSKVFLTELGGDAWIGDETIENFKVLIVECAGQKMEFDTWSSNNNFALFLTWLDKEN